MDFVASLAQGFATISTVPVALALGMVIGTVTGIVVGVLPGVGPGVTIAVMLPFTYRMPPMAGIALLLGVYVGSYPGGAVTSILIRTPGEASSIMTMFDGSPMAKRGATDPTPFGEGNPEGIIAAEAANNSVSGGAMITVLALGIPGDAMTAIIMGVFVVHGIVPGPSLFADRPEIVNGIFAGLLVMLLLIWGVKYPARLAYVDPRKPGLAILTLCLLGAYSSANSWYLVWLALGFGVFCLVCARCRIPTIPMVLGMVMRDTLEANLRQDKTPGQRLAPEQQALVTTLAAYFDSVRQTHW